MFGRGRGQHPAHCQCGVCRGNNMRAGEAEKLFRLVGMRFNVRAAKEAERFGYLGEFSPKLADAIEHLPEAARLWEGM